MTYIGVAKADVVAKLVDKHVDRGAVKHPNVARGGAPDRAKTVPAARSPQLGHQRHLQDKVPVPPNVDPHCMVCVCVCVSWACASD